ncbi:MAG TPA: hypothetical protein DCM05_03255 [Elusimicrobia bacterium]|nr:hypothetical protein [Elusimicrobiota bacterium]
MIKLLLLLLSLNAEAATLNSGAAFLKIGTGARPEAMGGAYTALADDVSALHYNPAGLSSVLKKEAGITHTEYLLGSKFDFVGYAHPTKLGTFGLGFVRLDTGNQEARNADRQAIGGFSAADSAYTLGFSRRLSVVSLGANIKYLESKIGSDSASTFAMDLGAARQLGKFSLGLSVLNVGQGMKFISQRDPLPLTFSVGGAYRLGGALNLALDVRHEPNDRRTDIGLGTEYAVLPMFSLRAGYATAGSITSARNGSSPLNGLGGGFGLKLKGYRADYTFTPFGDLGNVQRISLGVGF